LRGAKFFGEENKRRILKKGKKERQCSDTRLNLAGKERKGGPRQFLSRGRKKSTVKKSRGFLGGTKGGRSVQEGTRNWREKVFLKGRRGKKRRAFGPSSEDSSWKKNPGRGPRKKIGCPDGYVAKKKT